MPELRIRKTYFFNHVKDCVLTFKIQRKFLKQEGISIHRFKSYIEDILLIKKYTGVKFPENFFTVNFIPKINKIEVIVYR